MSKEIIKGHYDERYYAHSSDINKVSFYLRIIKPHLVRGKTLDVGCGDALLDKQIKDSYGVELSHEGAVLAHKNINNVFVGDGFQPPFKKESFQNIIVLGTAEYMEKNDVDSFVSSLFQLMPVGGTLIMTVNYRRPRLINKITKIFTNNNGQSKAYTSVGHTRKDISLLLTKYFKMVKLINVHHRSTIPIYKNIVGYRKSIFNMLSTEVICICRK